jgi:hypothetical protein
VNSDANVTKFWDTSAAPKAYLHRTCTTHPRTRNNGSSSSSGRLDLVKSSNKIDDLLTFLLREHAHDAPAVYVGVGAFVEVLGIDEASFGQRLKNSVEKLKLIGCQLASSDEGADRLLRGGAI